MNSIISKFESLKSVIRVRDDITSRINKLRLDKNEYIDDLPKDVMNLLYQKLSQDHITSYPETSDLYNKLAEYHNVE